MPQLHLPFAPLATGWEAARDRAFTVAKKEADEAIAAAATRALHGPRNKSGKALSVTPDAVRKREERLRKKNQLSKPHIAATDANIPVSVVNEDGKTVAHLAPPKPPPLSKKRKQWDAGRKDMVLEALEKFGGAGLTPDFKGVANRLRLEHPQVFGEDSGFLLSHQQVRNFHLQRDSLPKHVRPSRPAPCDPQLQEETKEAIFEMLTAVLASKGARYSAKDLATVARGVILKSVDADKIVDRVRSKKRAFKCSKNWVLRFLRSNKFRYLAPCGDSRKLPANYKQLCHDMCLRLAYFVHQYSIPPGLVVNCDHTGVMYTQARGKGWVPPGGDAAFQGVGDKRQFTAVVSTAADGSVLPLQVVVNGESAGSFPSFEKTVSFKETVKELVTKGSGQNQATHKTLCYVPTFSPEKRRTNPIPNIGSTCVTYNHWSDWATSRAYVEVREGEM